MDRHCHIFLIQSGQTKVVKSIKEKSAAAQLLSTTPVISTLDSPSLWK